MSSPQEQQQSTATPTSPQKQKRHHHHHPSSVKYREQDQLLAKIGPYNLVKVLGKGSYAVVKLGIHEVTGQKVAAKIINKEMVSRKSKKGLRQIEREILLLQMMDHPNVTKMIDVLETEEYLVIIMEFVGGGDFYGYIKRFLPRPIPEDRAFLLFYQLLSGLDYCHSCGIAHRDIKPENMLLDEDEQTIKLSDFGMGQFVSPNPDQLMETACGSPHYIAPEIIRGEKYSGPAADVWSLGIVLYAMMAGRLPFVHASVPKLLEMICHGSYAMPFQFDKNLRHLISRMLHPSPKQRISISKIKTHPWWLERCTIFHLNPNGTCAVVRPSAESMKMATPAVATPAASAEALPAWNWDQPILEHPLLHMDVSQLSSDPSELAERYHQLRALVAHLTEENQTIRELVEEHQQRNAAAVTQEAGAMVWIPEKMGLAVGEPLDAEVVDYIVEVQGWATREALLASLNAKTPNMDKAYYHLLLQQRRVHGSLAHLRRYSGASPERSSTRSPFSASSSPETMASPPSSVGGLDQELSSGHQSDGTDTSGSEKAATPTKRSSSLKATKIIAAAFLNLRRKLSSTRASTTTEQQHQQQV